MAFALVKKTNFEGTLKYLNKKTASNKVKHVEAEKKITDLTNKVSKMLQNKIWFFVRQNVFYR